MNIFLHSTHLPTRFSSSARCFWNAQLFHRCKSTEHILDAGVEDTASDWLENSGITQFVPQFLPAPLARLFVLLPALGEQIIPSVLVANR